MAYSSPPKPPPSIPAHQPSSPTKKAKTKPKPPSPPPPAASDEESDEIEDFSSDDDRDAREPSPTPTPAPLLVRKSAKAKGKEREVEKEALEEDSDEIQDPDSPPSTPAPPPAPKFRNSFGKKPIISSTPSKPFLKPPRQPPPALHTPTSLRSPNPPSSPSPTLPLLHPSSTPAPPSSGVTSFSDGRALRRIDTDSDGPWTPDPRCSEAQLEALEAVKKGENVFLTGPAGTGKSFLLHEIRAQLSHANKALFVTATTGIASLSIDGITLHSFAGIGLADKPVEQLVGRCRARRLANWKETDVLVVDEISMLHPDVFTKLSMIGKIIREDQRPFGGIQLIVCGDFFQLPPVPDEPSCFRCGKKSLTSLSAQSASLSPESPIDGVPLAKVKRCNAGGCGFAFRQREFAFETEAWAECDFTTIELTRVFRQDDPELISTLSRIRQGICTDADEKLITSGGSIVCEPFPSTKLYPLRKSVAKENKFEFDKIREKTVGFGARDVATGKHHVENLKTALSVEAHGRLVDFRAALSVELKIGAQVMLLFNLDPSAKLANGSLGKVVGWEKIPKLDYAVTSGEFGSKEWEAFEAEQWLEAQTEGRVLPVVEFDCGITREWLVAE
ncbi:hypothetical protein RQP46_007244 [Phenoliferia psychrophenolica]